MHPSTRLPDLFVGLNMPRCRQCCSAVSRHVMLSARRPHAANLAAVEPVQYQEVEEVEGELLDELEHRQNLERLYQLPGADQPAGDEAMGLERLLGEVEKIGKEADSMLSDAMQIPQIVQEVEELGKAFESLSSSERAARVRHVPAAQRRCAGHHVYRRSPSN
jgi:hypothetical protein